MPSEIKTATVAGAATTSGTTQDVTISGLGWTPKLALVFSTGADAEGETGNAFQIIGIGASDGTTDLIRYLRTQDNVATTAEYRQSSSSRSIVDSHSSPRLGLVDMIADGVRITWNGTPSTAHKFVVVLFGGADLSYDIRTFTPNSTQNGTASVSGLSFQPTLLFAACQGSTENVGLTNHAILTFGACDADLNQYSTHYYAQHNVSTSNVGSYIESNGISGQFYNGTLNWSAEVTAIASDGYTVTTRDGGSGGDTLLMVAIDTGDRSTKVMAVDSPTSTGNKDFAPGFTPQITGLWFTKNTAYDTSKQDAGTMGAAHFTPDDVISWAYNNEDNQTTTDIHTYFESDSLIIPAEGGGSNVHVATLVDADTLNFSTVEATTRKWWSWHIEEESAGGAVGRGLLLSQKTARLSLVG